MKPFLIIALGALLFYSQPSPAFQVKSPRPSLFLTADNLYTQSLIDQTPGASYSERFANTLALSAVVGVRLAGFLWLGLRYEYWYARRQSVLGGVSRRDTLRYQAAGIEIGYQRLQPRVSYLVAVSALYPVDLRIESDVTYKSNQRPWTLGARAAVGVRVSGPLYLILEGGYRMAKLGNLTSGSSSLLEGGSLDLSGPFLGVGLSVTL